MMMDIVERLRRTELHHVWDDLEGKMVGKMFSANPDGPEAADEIERLHRLIDKHINEKAEFKRGMIDILEYLSSVQIAEVNIKHIARKALGEIPDAALKEGE